MPRDRRRHALLLLLALLAACSTPRQPRPGSPSLPAAPQPAGPVCRVAPDGGPPLADRGIGGTGAPAIRQADRGIGGTGITLAARPDNDTGIVAVITGFGSICLGGREVATGPTTAILLDGTPAAQSDLRAGQLAIVDAAGPDDSLRAARVRVRHEVSGPVLSAAPGALVVAGQRVAVAPSTLGMRPAVNDWVAVSGLRDQAGLIHATRIDLLAGPRTRVRIAGMLAPDRLLLGDAAVVAPPGLNPLGGDQVIVTGRWIGNTLYAETIEPDPLATGPAGYFGPGVAIVSERFAEVRGDHLVLSRTLESGRFGSVGPGVRVELERRSDGGLGGGPGMPRTDRGPGRFEPAPTPDRGIGPAGGPGGGGPGTGSGPGARPNAANPRGRDRGPDRGPSPDGPPGRRQP